ncbi:cycloheximide-inducible CIP70 (cytochrome P450 family) [Fusarium phyllophilum]|uniref:Cycloheximide-inducible CIP70 (Cytochrome P450 family) n=1 Tax=Fusarium phyllophilum TaxID=47803 RepID=A0A8H5KC19_9HYPO|nr:cycloheximide-inducible CIP70 (cytochrome P450 family) [Fusarium phyllophilum]
MASFQRKVLKPFTLSNGQVIPAGVTIEIPAVAVSSDSNVFPHAEKFDPLRFYRLRTEAKDGGSVEKAANNQFVSVNQSSLTFGYGRHACPGRFFAANEIKMILAHALLQYDVKNLGDATERYPNMEFAHMSIPDPSKKLMFKSIEEVGLRQKGFGNFGHIYDMFSLEDFVDGACPWDVFVGPVKVQ